MNKKDDNKNILATAFNSCFECKNHAMENIGGIQKYLDKVNLYNSKHVYYTSEEFVYLLESRIPFALGSWIESERNRNKIKDYQTNLYMYNLNDISMISRKQYAKFYSTLMKGPFRYVQESNCSEKSIEEKRFHLYLPVTELKGVGFDIQQIIYENVREELELKLGVPLDSSFYLHKNIIPSGNKVQINKNAPVYDLRPKLKKIKRIGRIYEKEFVSTTDLSDKSKRQIVPTF